jgi:glycosyltransferase involved in cell wall biosynthesis
MRVAHILNELKFSGAEMLLTSGLEYLRLPDDVHTVISTGVVEGEYAATMKTLGFQIFHLPFSKSPAYFIRLLSHLLTQKYDVIHVHAERASVWHAFVSRIAGIPCIRTIHNEFQFTGLLRIRRKIGRSISTALGVAHVSCSARVSRNELARFGTNTLIIDNWLDPKRVRTISRHDRDRTRQKLGITGDEFVVVSVGNYGTAKNQESIVRAVRFISHQLPVHYYHCGERGDDLLRATDSLSHPNIKAVGAVDNVGDYLVAADVFVSMSYYEGGPIALLEAGAAGLCCITTRAGLAEEFSGTPGVTFVEPDAESLVAALLAEFSRSPEQREQDGQVLSQFVRNRFVPSIGARRYRELYESIAGPKTAN